LNLSTETTAASGSKWATVGWGQTSKGANVNGTGGARPAVLQYANVNFLAATDARCSGARSSAYTYVAATMIWCAGHTRVRVFF
jgi:hypothetical protein